MDKDNKKPPEFTGGFLFDVLHHFETQGTFS